VPTDAAVGHVNRVLDGVDFWGVVLGAGFVVLRFGFQIEVGWIIRHEFGNIMAVFVSIRGFNSVVEPAVTAIAYVRRDRWGRTGTAG